MSDQQKLREAVARTLAEIETGWPNWWQSYTVAADAAIAVALEEAARVAENHTEWNPFPTRHQAIAAAIRALIPSEADPSSS